MTATALRPARNTLESDFRLRVLDGIQRRSIIKCSQWTRKYRIMGKPHPGPWRSTYYPWTVEMMDTDCESCVGQKGAQVAYTETMINRALFCMDIKNTDVLYILPAQTPDAKDFSASRFDPAIEMSPHLKQMFSDVKNVGLKRAGSTSLFIRGSRGQGGLRSLPVGLVIADERDIMDRAKVAEALERLSGQDKKQIWQISTPRIPGEGINKDYLTSTMEIFTFRCPGCQRHTDLTFPECLKITGDQVNDPAVLNSHLVCKECGIKLPQETKHVWLADGKWVPQNANRTVRGFHINQLYSSTVKPWDIANAYLRAQNDPADEQEFWNSKQGLPYIVKGARLTDEEINMCVGDYLQKQYLRRDEDGRINEKQLQIGPRTMGIDVGTDLHVIIKEWRINRETRDINQDSRPKIIKITTVRDFFELDQLMADYNIASAIIDANPERRAASDFAKRFHKRVRLCFYGENPKGREATEPNEADSTVTVDRTSWLDLTLGRYKNGTVSIPKDRPLEFSTHLKAQVRVYLRDKIGNPIGRYVKGSDADHYAHADNYAEIALRFLNSVGEAEDITERIW